MLPVPGAKRSVWVGRWVVGGRTVVVPRGSDYDKTSSYSGRDYRKYSRGSRGPRDVLRTVGTCSGVGRIVKIIDKGKNINGSFIASSLTMRVTGTKCGIKVLSTSVAKPSVPGVFKTRNRLINSRGKVCPCRAGRKVGVISVGLLVRSRRTPII